MPWGSPATHLQDSRMHEQGAPIPCPCGGMYVIEVPKETLVTCCLDKDCLMTAGPRGAKSSS